MTTIEEQAVEHVKKLVSNFDKLEFKADIGDTSYYVSFNIWIDGIKNQCYQLVDDGIVEEHEVDNLFADYADFVRNNDEYKRDVPNIINFTYDTLQNTYTNQTALGDESFVAESIPASKYN